MAERFKDIKVSFRADDTQIRQVLGRVGKQSEAMGSKVKKASVGTMLGFRSITNAAERLGQGLGLQTAYMTDLSQAFEQQAQRGIPRWVMALGGAALGLGALALAVKAVIDRQKKHREEIMQSAKAADALINKFKGLATSTDSLTDAQERYSRAMLKFRRFDLVERIEEQKKAVEDLRREYIKASGVRYELINEDDLKRMGKARAEWEAGQEQLIVFQEQLTVADEILASRRTLASIKREEARRKELITEKRYGDAMVAEFRRRQQESERVDQMIMASRIATAQNFALTFQLMSQLGTKHARKWFSAYKIAATAEALISSYAAFAKTLREPHLPYPLNIAAAGSILALGLAKVAAIKAQTFSGGGGAGAAVGTFPASPATGLPTTGQGFGGLQNITINIVDPDGTVRSSYQVTRDVLNELDRSNGTIDGITVPVSRSA